jgi:hypothetical protein
MDGSPCLPIGLTQPRHFRPGVVQPHPLRRGMALLRQMRATLPLPAKRGAALSPLAWHNPSSAACDPLHNRTLLGKTAARFYFLIIYSLFLFCCPPVIGVLESSSESCQKKTFLCSFDRVGLDCGSAVSVCRSCCRSNREARVRCSQSTPGC